MTDKTVFFYFLDRYALNNGKISDPDVTTIDYSQNDKKLEVDRCVSNG